MAYDGTARVVRRELVEALVFEVFDVELDNAAWEEMAKDQRGFVRELMEAEGIPIAGIWNEETIKPEGPTPPDVQVYHCIAPPEHESKMITIVIGPTPQ